MSGSSTGKIYIHNCTHLVRDRKDNRFAPKGLEVAVRLDYNSPTPVMFLKPGETRDYTPTKDFVKFKAEATAFQLFEQKLGPVRPAEWNTSFGMRKIATHYYIVQSGNFGLAAAVRQP